MPPTRDAGGRVRGAVTVDRPRAVLGLSVAAYFSVRFAQLLVSPVVPDIVATFGVSRAAIGTALSGMWVVYALVQLPSAALGDHVGGRRVVVVALALAGLGSLATAAAPSYPGFVVFVLLLGTGAGLYYNAATGLLVRVADDVGSAVGVHRVGSQLAGVSAPVVATALLGYGWRVAVGVGALVVLVVLGAFAWGVRPVAPRRPDRALRAAVGGDRLRSVLARPPIVVATSVAVLAEFVTLATMTFLPLFLVQHHGLDVRDAGLLFSGYFAVVAVGQPVSGWVSDRAGRDVTLAVALGLGVVGYGLLAATRSPAGAAAGVVFAGAAMSWPTPLQSRVVETLGADERGVGFGVVRTLYILLGASGGAVVGGVSDAAGWTAAFLLLAALLAVALGVLLVGGRRRRSRSGRPLR